MDLDYQDFLLLGLLLLANGAPLIAREFLDWIRAVPLDGGRHFADGRPFLGPTKTLRGVIASLLLTALGSWLIGLGWQTGALIGIFAMLGDLTSSFLKRRLGLLPSSMALGLDQVPESLFPLLAVRDAMALSWGDILTLVALFFVSELLLSRLLYLIGLRKHPY